MRGRRTAPETIVVDATAGDGPVGVPDAPGAPVLIGIVGREPADSALRIGFAEADRRAGPVVVLGVGPAGDAAEEAGPADAAGRWSDKYPDVPVTVVERRTVDAA